MKPLTALIFIGSAVILFLGLRQTVFKKKIVKYNPPRFQFNNPSFPINPNSPPNVVTGNSPANVGAAIENPVVSDHPGTDPDAMDIQEMKAPEVNKMDHVMNNIYISNWYSATNEQLLKQNNIKFIVCINKEFKKNSKNMAMYERLGIRQMTIIINDRPEEQIKNVFKQVYSFIEAANGQNVLIHCSMGISRSACLVVAYLLMKMKNSAGKSISLDQAYTILKAKRTCANINPGFMQQLKELEVSMN